MPNGRAHREAEARAQQAADGGAFASATRQRQRANRTACDSADESREIPGPGHQPHFWVLVQVWRPLGAVVQWNTIWQPGWNGSGMG